MWSEVQFCVLYFIVQYSPFQWSTEQSCFVQCSPVQCSPVQCSAVQCSTVQWVEYSALSTWQCSRIQRSAVLFSTLQIHRVYCNACQDSLVDMFGKFIIYFWQNILLSLLQSCECYVYFDIKIFRSLFISPVLWVLSLYNTVYVTDLDTVSVLERDKGYTVKYEPLPEGVPEGKAQGNSWRQWVIWTLYHLNHY